MRGRRNHDMEAAYQPIENYGVIGNMQYWRRWLA